MRLAFLSIPKEISSNTAPSDAYRTSGNNLGNMVFVNAISDQLNHQNSIFSYSLDAVMINNEFDAVVIPAANWLNPGIDLGGFYEVLKNVRKPCILIGVGAQSHDYQSIPELPKGTRNFLDFISSNSNMIGARGFFSEKVLHHYGYTSGNAIGCPSLYWNCATTPPSIRSKKSSEPETIVIQGTRHNIPDNEFYKTGNAAKQREIIIFAREQNLPYIIQSEYEEFVFINEKNQRILNDITKKLESYYSEDLSKGLSKYLCENMYCFYDVASWRETLKKFDFLLTSRIHGSIMALHSGTPSLLMCHDTRTLEIAEYAGLPHINHNINLEIKEIKEALHSIDYNSFNKKYHQNYSNYYNFLLSNKLENNLEKPLDLPPLT